MLNSKFFSEALGENSASIALNIELSLINKFEGKAIIPCRRLDVEEFATMGLCELVPANEPHPALFRYWGGEEYDRLYTSYQQIVWQVTWNGSDLLVVHMEWATGCGEGRRIWVIAESIELAETFILDVERKTHAPSDAILVFANGCWSRSRNFYAATQKASFDDLILADEMKETIRSDFNDFLKSESRYQGLGIAWRRGALFVGPPGNGKTHCVRAMVKELNIPSLYVQSLSHSHYTAEQMWQIVFERARGLRPCVLILEDLDSLVDDQNRSFFLNQLDGFEQNHGLIVLATTNHPERIDSAIIDRPSRFDRKYHFNLPILEERCSFLAIWQQRLAAEVDWKADQVKSAGAITEGFSFAYLKELVISSIMKWVHEPASSFSDTMKEQAEILQSQMTTDA